ncbi:hypothetical protein HDU98_004241 [Podochytrium sp. JEL0797]|nr:hypothetical protein HDU98_004241 [Podochytrium sp. JEL0797]
MWNPNPVADVQDLTQTDMAFLDSLLEDEQFADPLAIYNLGYDPSCMTQLLPNDMPLDPFFGYDPYLASSLDPLQRGFDSTPGLHRLGLGAEVLADFGLRTFVPNPTMPHGQAIIPRSFSDNNLAGMLQNHHNQPFQLQQQQSPNQQYPFFGYQNSPASIAPTPVPHHQQSPSYHISIPPAHANLPQQQYHPSPNPRKIACPKLRVVQQHIKSSPASKAIRHVRTLSAPVSYSRMTPSLIMSSTALESNPNNSSSSRMTPCSVLKLENETCTSPTAIETSFFPPPTAASALHALPPPPTVSDFSSRVTPSSLMAAASVSNTPTAPTNATFSFREPQTRRSSPSSSEDDNSTRLRATNRPAVAKPPVIPASTAILTAPRVTTTPYDRKTYRKEAERHRREMLKVSFDEVKHILPRDSFSTRLPSKEKVLDTAREYIEDLRDSAQVKAQAVSEMEREIEWLRFSGLRVAAGGPQVAHGRGLVKRVMTTLPHADDYLCGYYHFDWLEEWPPAPELFATHGDEHVPAMGTSVEQVLARWVSQAFAPSSQFSQSSDLLFPFMGFNFSPSSYQNNTVYYPEYFQLSVSQLPIRLTPASILDVTPTAHAFCNSYSSPRLPSHPSTLPKKAFLNLSGSVGDSPGEIPQITRDSTVPVPTHQSAKPKRITAKLSNERKAYRKKAEKTRREAIKNAVGQVKSLLPPGRFGETHSLPSQERVLDSALEYIEELLEEERVKRRIVMDLENEIRLLGMAKEESK